MAALSNLQELGEAAGRDLRNLVAAGLRAQWEAVLPNVDTHEPDWRRLAEERAFMIDHLKRHIHQLRTGQVPMPNGQYVANPMPPERGLAEGVLVDMYRSAEPVDGSGRYTKLVMGPWRSRIAPVEGPACTGMWGPTTCVKEPGYATSCRCILEPGHTGKCMCQCGQSP